MMVAKCVHFSKTDQTEHFKKVNVTTYKLYLNKDVKENIKKKRTCPIHSMSLEYESRISMIT